jgi:hypothetical protein
MSGDAPSPTQEHSAFLRAIEMLRVSARYIRDNYLTDCLIHYDGVDCDGECVALDCVSAADDLIWALAIARKDGSSPQQSTGETDQ